MYTNYYPFGMTQPGRNSNINLDRYGMNGQERDNEIDGTGNIYTAEFWEYDSKTGERWNRDPVPNPSTSDYSTFGNNPILRADPLGNTDEERAKALKKAKEYKDKSKGNSSAYKLGSKGNPGEAVDCSGLVSKCVAAAEVNDPNHGDVNGVTNIVTNISEVNMDDIQEGYVVTFNNNKHIGFVSGDIKRDANGKVVSFTVLGSQSSTGPGEFKVQTDKSSKWENKNNGYWSPLLGKAYKWDTPDGATKPALSKTDNQETMQNAQTVKANNATPLPSKKAVNEPTAEEQLMNKVSHLSR